MRNVITIAWRDFKNYFTSPIAYIVIAVFLGIMGWMFFFTLEYFFNQTLQMQQYGSKGPSLTDGVIRPLYGNMNVILLFLMPFITMRLFAEERKNQTLTLLLTSPVKLSEIVIGKFISACWLLEVMVGLTLVYPIILYFTGNPEVAPIIACLLGTLLLGSCYVAVGLLFSAMTENQIVAGALTFFTLLIFWLISWATQSAGGFWGDILEYLSLIGHFQNFSRGIISTTDIVFYVSFMCLGLFLTVKVLDSYRWRS